MPRKPILTIALIVIVLCLVSPPVEAGPANQSRPIQWVDGTIYGFSDLGITDQLPLITIHIGNMTVSGVYLGTRTNAMGKIQAMTSTAQRGCLTVFRINKVNYLHLNAC